MIWCVWFTGEHKGSEGRSILLCNFYLVMNQLSRFDSHSWKGLVERRTTRYRVRAFYANQRSFWPFFLFVCCPCLDLDPFLSELSSFVLLPVLVGLSLLGYPPFALWDYPAAPHLVWFRGDVELEVRAASTTPGVHSNSLLIEDLLTWIREDMKLQNI